MRNQQFGALVTEGIASIAHRWQKTRAGVLLEMRDVLLANGANVKDSTLAGWCKGFVPKDLDLVTWLASYCVRQGRVDRQWAESLLFHARFPERERLLAELFPSQASPPHPSESAIVAPAVMKRVDDPLIPRRSVPAVGLVGRESVINSIKTQLISGHQQALCAIQGLPGVGKTALAVTLAQDPDLLAHFSDGMLWAGLGRTPSLIDIFSRWARLLGLAPSDQTRLQTIQDWSHAVREAIGARRLLLILDDAWSVDVALICQVGGPGCAHLITTRSPEIALSMAGAGTVQIPELDESAGRQLIAYLAPEAIAAEPEAAAHLVQTVGGLPLALVLVGKYLQAEAFHRQPRRLRAALDRLQQATERLQLGQPVSPSEQSSGLPPVASLSLAASIGVSYQALNKSARSILLALAVFPPKPNNFSEEAALAVADCPAHQLDRLSDTGLIESSGTGRYTLHQTIADYAGLQRHGEQSRERMATFYAHYVEAHHADDIALDRESANIVAALQAAFERNMPAVLVKGITAFAPYLLARGSYATAEEHLIHARDAAQTTKDLAGLATVQLQLGRLEVRRGDYAQAEEALREGLILARQTNHDKTLSAMLQTLGLVQAKQGNAEQAEHYYQEGLRVARKIDDQQTIGLILRNLGSLANKRGDLVQSERYYQDALALERQLGQAEKVSTLLANLGVVALTRGEYTQAEAYLQEGLALSRQLGHRENMILLLINLGVVAARLDRDAQAELYQQEALDLARQIGHREMTAVLLTDLGDLAGKRDEFGRAEELFREGLALAREINHRHLISYNLGEWGDVLLRQQHIDQAATMFSESLALAREIQAPELMAVALFGLAEIGAAQGDTAQALHHGQESLTIFEAIGHSRVAEVRSMLDSLPVANGQIDIHDGTSSED
jgi:tetratricopeptide (TPR) repeat protein